MAHAIAQRHQSTPHFHHGYWRFDFTVQTSSNNLIFEIRRLRDAAHQRRWRVQHADSGRGYTIHIVGIAWNQAFWHGLDMSP
jgi:hypothetical protein